MPSTSATVQPLEPASFYVNRTCGSWDTAVSLTRKIKNSNVWIRVKLLKLACAFLPLHFSQIISVSPKNFMAFLCGFCGCLSSNLTPFDADLKKLIFLLNPYSHSIREFGHIRPIWVWSGKNENERNLGPAQWGKLIKHILGLKKLSFDPQWDQPRPLFWGAR